jgi:hypothetical protein
MRPHRAARHPGDQHLVPSAQSGPEMIVPNVIPGDLVGIT